MSPKRFWLVLKNTMFQYVERGGPWLGAAVAFYALLSVAPLALIVLSTVRWLLGEGIGGQELADHLSLQVDPKAQDWLTLAIGELQASQGSGKAGLIGTLLLLWSGTRVFSQLEGAINQLWAVKSNPVGIKGNILGTLKRHAIALFLVFVLGALLALSVVGNSAAQGLNQSLAQILPGGERIYQVVPLALSVLLLTANIALLFRILPAGNVAWRDAFAGAVTTAILLAAAASPLSFYLSQQSQGGFFGAAGSVIMFLLWLYYAAQLLFLGAQFTAVWAKAHGRPVRPAHDAVLVSTRTTQGTSRDLPPTT